jgi:2-methylaconitate cis-trans-isomerase PrpF
MRKFKAVYMRGGTSKGLLFHKKDLPADQAEWDSIFLQAMGNPDPKQIDGMGGTVSSNNKIVVVWKSEESDIDVEYLVGQVIVGKQLVDYQSNCGNMTACVGPFALDEDLFTATGQTATVRLFNRNTNKRIEATFPVENGAFALTGDCKIAGIDGTGAEIRVNFLDPAGSKTGMLLPTGSPCDILDVPGFGRIEATLLDVSNPTVLVRAEDIGLTATELPAAIDGNEKAADVLETIRGVAACKMGFAKDLREATERSPAVPKIGFFASPQDYADLTGAVVSARDIDLCARVISVFKCHKACPLTSASSIAVATMLKGSVLQKTLAFAGRDSVRIGHPGGVMTVYPKLEQGDHGAVTVRGVTHQRTARRIMDGNLYIRA